MATDPRKYFNDIILPCSSRMYAAALAITDSPGDAADAVQTAMLRIWDAIGNGTELQFPMSYCLSTVRNVCLSEISRGRRTVSIDNVHDTASAGSRAEDAIELQEVSEAMNRLPSNERHAIEMRAFSGCSADEIAEALGTTPTNARQILSRGRKRLRSFFEKKG